MKILVALLLCLCVSCASLTPSNKRAEHIIHSYFKDYAKKYPTTPFGEKGVEKVEIISQKQLRKNYSAADTYVYLKTGDIIQVDATLQKKAIMWKLLSWENPYNEEQ